jgi:hypothetical protein
MKGTEEGKKRRLVDSAAYCRWRRLELRPMPTLESGPAGAGKNETALNLHVCHFPPGTVG